MKSLRISSLLVGAAALASLVFTGCLNDSSRTGDARLTLSMKVTDLDKSKGKLGKGSVIKLKKLVITMTSNVPSDSVIRDTILAADSAGSKFVSNSDSDQTFSKPYAVKPLRNWTIVVKTLDTRDSVVHKDSVQALKLLAGETRNILLDMAARFVTYAVKFSLPDSLTSNTSGISQQIVITRLVMKLDGTIALDSTKPAGFKPDSMQIVTFDYIRANTTPDVTIQFFGHSAGTNDTLLFEAIIPDVDPEVEQLPIKAAYVGPGAGGNGGAIAGLNIRIGKVKTIEFETSIGDTIAVKRSAR